MFSPPVSAGMKGPVQQGGGNMEMYNAYKQGKILLRDLLIYVFVSH
jgi:hypothetical protein